MWAADPHRPHLYRPLDARHDPPSAYCPTKPPGPGILAEGGSCLERNTEMSADHTAHQGILFFNEWSCLTFAENHRGTFRFSNHSNTVLKHFPRISFSLRSRILSWKSSSFREFSNSDWATETAISTVSEPPLV